ncbi:hypothetical protein OSB04_025871 [Centaurea solstitialis]|uniref:Uncharacterized protein n=1 Tax=Centaurea solstitialis TaxID=347529 RepID=A0AA38SNV9_9ASTR|nr:hypothetical protein OSB04_025871 [Centaurea solstitialis]
MGYSMVNKDDGEDSRTIEKRCGGGGGEERTNKAHSFDMSVALVVQILESNDGKIHKACILLVEPSINTAVPKKVVDIILEQIKQLGSDSNDGK